MNIIHQLFIACDDLEIKYIKLIYGRAWTGNDKRVLMVEFSEAHVLAAQNNTVISFDNWVKIASCHHCGEKSHICLDCPKFKAGSPATYHCPTSDFVQ